MNKKIYTAPEMETVKIETQRVIASSSLEAGKYNNDGEGGESGTPDLPDVDTSGSIFGD
jgi:hypothetical protein